MAAGGIKDSKSFGAGRKNKPAPVDGYFFSLECATVPQRPDTRLSAQFPYGVRRQPTLT
jgi:hypothetical protein